MADHQQLCPFCEVEGRALNSMYCPPCGIRLYQPFCSSCGTAGAYPELDARKKELFLIIIRGFSMDSAIPEAAMKLLRILHTAGIYNEHRESLEACLSVFEESPIHYSTRSLLIYLATEYRDNSEEWFNKHHTDSHS
jgi:hypothetical protein